MPPPPDNGLKPASTPIQSVSKASEPSVRPSRRSSSVSATKKVAKFYLIRFCDFSFIKVGQNRDNKACDYMKKERDAHAPHSHLM